MPKPFEANDSRINRKGRPKGKPNRSTEELRNLLKDFFELNFNEIQTSFEELEGKEKINTLLKICQLIMPAPQNELERLTDEQLDELIERLKQQNNSQHLKAV